MINEQFTKEAIAMLEHYLLRYEESLIRSNMSPEEIEDILEEVRQHIIDHCKLKAGDENVITTDQVRSAIQKLGEPEIVEKVLQEELDAFEQVKGTPRAAELTITAEQAVQIFKYLSILSTVFAVAFVVLGTTFPVYYLFQTHVLLLLLSLAWYQIIRTRPAFQTNAYLERYIRLDFPHLAIPQGLLLYMVMTRMMNPDIYTFALIFTITALPFFRDAQNFYRTVWGRLNYVQPRA